MYRQLAENPTVYRFEGSLPSGSGWLVGLRRLLLLSADYNSSISGSGMSNGIRFESLLRCLPTFSYGEHSQKVIILHQVEDSTDRFKFYFESGGHVCLGFRHRGEDPTNWGIIVENIK